MAERYRPSIDEWIILTCGGLLLVVSFAPWYWTDVGGTVDQRTAWQGPGLVFALLGILAAEIMAFLVVARMTGTTAASTIDAKRWGTIHLAGGVVAFLAIVARMLAGSDQGTWGLYLGLLLTGGLLLGGLGTWKSSGGWWPSLLGDGASDSAGSPVSQPISRRPDGGPPVDPAWGRPQPQPAAAHPYPDLPALPGNDDREDGEDGQDGQDGHDHADRNHEHEESPPVRR